jgi:antitoxin component YwqK of YwqJK toxin-antitoxin module
MKNIARILSALMILILVGCGELKQVDISELRLDENTVHYKNSEELFTGRVVKYNQQGTLLVDYEVHDGQFNGPYLGFHEDGKPQEKSTMKDGLRDGEAKYWDQEGHLMQVTTYTKGKRNGPSTNYWTGGGKALESFFDNDVPAGTWKQWDPDGTLVKETTYVDGKEVSSTGPGVKIDNATVPELPAAGQ